MGSDFGRVPDFSASPGKQIFRFPSTSSTTDTYQFLIRKLGAALQTEPPTQALPLLLTLHPVILPIPAADRRHREDAVQAGRPWEARRGEAAQESSRRRSRRSRRGNRWPYFRTY
jgi:hypothetical protein